MTPGIRYVTGDATHPEGKGTRMIVHVCNDVGAWGAGFTAAISKRWSQPESVYRDRARTGLKLGTIHVTNAHSGWRDTVLVVNMIAQHGLPDPHDRAPIRYDALAVCLGSAATYARSNSYIEREEGVGSDGIITIHMPRIGCGLAGGTWDKVEPIIAKELAGLSVTVYDLPR